VLELDVTPCLAPPLARAQWLGISANGHPLGGRRIEGPCRLRCRIAPGLLDARQPIRLDLAHPCFIRLDWLGVDEDDRPLAIRFFGLRLHAEPLPPDWEASGSLRADVPRLDLRPPPAPAAPDAQGAELARHQFGPGQAETAGLRGGWRVDADGLLWTAARVSELALPAAGWSGPVILRLGLAPLTLAELLPAQRLAVIADGLMLGQFSLASETELSVALPPGMPDPDQPEGSARVTLTLVTPAAIELRDFARDQDHDQAAQALGVVLDWIVVERAPARLARALALRGDDLAPAPPLAVSREFLGLPEQALREAVLAACGMAPDALLRGFESLGDNCAFGLAQRRAGAEVLGLLRFANTPLRALLRGLADGFRAATEAAAIELYLAPDEPREYMLRIPRYGVTWHTMIHEPDADAELVGREQRVRLGFLRRKFEQGLRAGRKIHVLARAAPRRIAVAAPGFDAPPLALESLGATRVLPAWDPPQAYEEAPPPLALAEAQAVLSALNRAGPNTLLYLAPATLERPAGTVELLAPGLLRGFMASLVILVNEPRPNDLDWVRVAANAWLFDRAARAAPGHGKETA
jgi:hypothetical protein